MSTLHAAVAGAPSTTPSQSSSTPSQDSGAPGNTEAPASLQSAPFGTHVPGVAPQPGGVDGGAQSDIGIEPAAP
jgi:hypothetical protein